MNIEKAITTIQKLLTTASDKGATKNEALMAALKAQELMAKYDISITDVTECEEEIKADDPVYVGRGNKWKYALASVVAKNFCCKVLAKGSRNIIFYGYKRHTEVAKSVFEYLFKMGVRLATSYVRKAKKDGTPNVGIYNTFVIGYLDGISSVLEKQCVALALVIPTEVVESFEEATKKSKKVTTSLKCTHNQDAYRNGKGAGKTAIQARELECSN